MNAQPHRDVCFILTIYRIAEIQKVTCFGKDKPANLDVDPQHTLQHARFTEMSSGLNIQCTIEGTVDYFLQVVF